MKILVLICSQEYVRNYLTTDAFSRICQEHELTLLIKDSIAIQNKDIRFFKNGFSYPEDKEGDIPHLFVNNILMLRNMHKSKSFVFRMQRTNCMPEHYSQFVNMANEDFQRFLINELPIREDFTSFVKENQFDLCLMPTSAYDPDVNNLIRCLHFFGVKSLCLVDNWDNLSSKTVMPWLPDFMAVWGRQSKIHATQIQGMDSAKVYTLGTPRVSRYFEARNSVLSAFPFRYGLFVGTALPFDESVVLHALASYLDGNPRYHDIKLVYRPHPHRQSDVIANFTTDRIVLDPQVESVYKAGRSSELTEFQPSIDYYPALLGGSEFVAGGFTSMLLEATIFNKKILGFAHCEPSNYTSPHRVYSEYVHFKELAILPNLKVCVDLKSIKKDFDELINANIDIEEVDRARRFFLAGEGKYAEDLLDIISDIAGYNE
jgi:hypothetical protein